jgi:hypothetical protein
MIPVHSPTKLQRRGRKFILLPIGRVLSPRIYETWYWNESEYREAFEGLLKSDADAIHANDWEALPVAVRAAQKMGAYVVADLHEYAPLMREDRSYWKWFYKPMIDYFLQKYLPYTSRSVTVGPTIADRYEREYAIDPIVVMNIPQYAAASEFKPTDSREIKLIHHGNAIRDRRLELMIKALAHAHPRYSLHFMLMKRNKGYISDLQDLARRLVPERVFFHSPVPPSEIVSRISEFDMGIYLMPSANFNQSAALPNKFFDFVASGLAVCIGPSPEMARLTEQFDFGLVSSSLDPKTVASLLNDLTVADIDRMKRKSIKARETLNAEVELGKLVDLYEALLS